MTDAIDIGTAAEQVEVLLNGFKDDADRARAQQLVHVLMGLYGATLDNMLKTIRESGDGAEWLLERLAADKLVASLLLVHGLHPIPAETRICRALAKLERALSAHRLIFEGLENGTARVRVEPVNGNTNGGPPAHIESAIEQAVRELAPEVEGVQVAGVDRPAALVQIGPLLTH